jgi:hypothetical protein
MSFASWLWPLRIRPATPRGGNSRRWAAAKRPATFRANVETLEARCLLTLFAPVTPFSVGAAPVSVAVGDFNHDGIPDLATANNTDNTVSVLLGNGDGTFRNDPNGPLQVGGFPSSVAVGDFNRDGVPDLAVANSNDNTVSVLLGNGDSGGTFQAATSYPAGPFPSAVAVGDFNGDGAPDLAVATDLGAVGVLLNQAPVTTTAVTASANPAVAGQLVTLKATVSQAVPAPTTPA